MSGLPKYKAIAGQLAEDIASGRLRGGDKLPGAFKLAEERGVSVVTANRALDQLVETGLVRRLGRSGTYVLDSSERLRSVLVPFSPAWYRDNPQMLLYLNGLLNEANRRNVKVQVEPCDSSLFDSGESVLAAGCQGIIQLGAGEPEFPLRSLKASGLPWVTAGATVDFGDASVMEDREQASYELVRMMMADGLKKIGMAADLRKDNHRFCRDGYLKATADLGVGASLIRDTDVNELDSHLEELVHLSKVDGVIVCGLACVRALGWLWRKNKNIALGCFEESQAITYLNDLVYLSPIDWDLIGGKALETLCCLVEGKQCERKILIRQKKPIKAR